MATKYIIINDDGKGYENTQAFKYDNDNDKTSVAVKSYKLKTGTICTRDSIGTTYNVDIGKKTYKLWKIKYDGKWMVVNADQVAPLKKYYTKKVGIFRKNKNGVEIDRWNNGGTLEDMPKGTLVYLLSKTFKANKGLNKTWIVSDKHGGYFFGSDLTTTNPNKKKSSSSSSDKKNDNKSSVEETNAKIDENASKKFREAIANRLVPAMIHAGLFTKKQIQYKKYSRFLRDPVLDPYGAITGTKEYLFFTKPDFHLLEESNNTLVLNPELSGISFFKEMRSRYPELLLQLQVSADGGLISKERYNKCYCTNLSQTLSYFSTGKLDLSSTTAKTIDTPETIFGNSIQYRADGHEGEFNIDFSISFKDDKYLTMYNYFKIWEEYGKLKKQGKITPPRQAYTTNRILHDQIGIWKFIVGEDGETIIYYAYITGAFPLTVPRDTFTDLTETPTYNIDWHGFHIDDMNPEILADFNFVASSKKVNNGLYVTTSNNESSFKEIIGDLAPMYDGEHGEIYRYPMWHPFVYAVHVPDEPCKTIYKLVWRKAGFDVYNTARSQSLTEFSKKYNIIS